MRNHLTKRQQCDIIAEQFGRRRRRGGTGRRIGLKIRWDESPVPVRSRSPAPNEDIYRGVEQLVARRAHNPEVVRFKSHPRNHIERPKKMPPEKPRVSSVFLVFSPFSSLFQKSVSNENKKMPIGKIDLWWGFEPMTYSFWGEFQSNFSEIRPFFVPYCKKYLLILCVCIWHGLRLLQKSKM